MTTETIQVTNGVNVTQLRETIDAIKKNPCIAKFKFRSRNRWLGGAHSRSEILNYNGVGNESRPEVMWTADNGEPPALLGEDTGANPVEWVLHGLAGCLTTSLVYHAAARGIEVRSVESEFEGDINLHGFLGLDPGVRNGYQEIRVKFRVEAPGATEEQIEELVKLAQQRSPVFDTVSRPVPVRVSLARD